MNIAVVGGRKFDNYELMKKTLDSTVKLGDCIVSGGAKGADSLARKYAIEHALDFIEFKPGDLDISLYGFSKAAQMRNQSIVNVSDMLIAFPDPDSRGTWISVRMAKEKGIPVEIINV